ncbi:MAG TPA: hypothetical protein VLT51_05170 [Anaerolineales bacterium]|nr:hypothetical protein [Anaerolineales bacterium]
MMELIIGAAIALVSSIITSLVVHGLELKRSKQTRLWQLEDTRRVAVSENIKSRITHIEDTIDTLWDVALSITKRESSLIGMTKDVSAQNLLRVILSEDEKSIQDILYSMKASDSKSFNKTSDKIIKHISQEDEYRERESELVSNAMKSLAYISSLNQEDLTKDATNLILLVAQESAQSNILLEAMKSRKKIAIKTERDRIQKFISKFIELHSAIINQIASLQIEGILSGEKQHG